VLLVKPYVPIPSIPRLVESITMFAAATLPAVAAALHGTVTAGEYHKLAEQSHEMCLRLGNLINRIVEAAAPADDDSDAEIRLRSVIEQFRDTTIEETVVWRRALRDKNVPLP
jgi:hypothetical protein